MISSCIRKAGVVACLVVCGGCAQVALVSVTPMIAALARHFDRATADRIVELEQKKNWDGMLELAQAQLQREPERAEWWVLQGYAQERLGQPAAAVLSYQQATRLSPEDEGAWLALGRSESALARPEQAIQAYRQALRYRPESAQAYLALAELYLQQGQPDLALPNYRESVRYDPELEQAWYGLASAYQRTGQNERRDEALKGLRRLDPAAADQFEKQYPLK